MYNYRLILARIEAALAVLAAALGIITIFWRDWIEILTGWNPDHHNGSAEMALIAVLFALSAACAVLARRTYRRLVVTS